ncbi:MAG: recombination mediator RecR [Legionellaceae bacterium]|nr:recombination mediator RecR [Legionellaceae bacterium]
MDSLSRLVDALRCLPGVGPKSAQRMVFHLLQHQRQRGLHLATCLEDAMNNVTHCEQCNNYTSEKLCNICQQPERDTSILCVVEGPTDVTAIEQSATYSGRYYVLMGRISPLDGIGPNDIGLNLLHQHIITTGIKEVILALSPTVEGQTTVHFIQELLKPHAIQVSQLAQGIPSGGELAFLDSITIGSALRNREILRNS